MATDSPKNMISSSDDDSGDEDASGGRRRRFCIERVPEAPPAAVKETSKRDRPTADYDGSGNSRSTTKRRMTEAPLHLEPRHDWSPYQRPSSFQRHHQDRLYQHPHSHQYQHAQPHFHPHQHQHHHHNHQRYHQEDQHQYQEQQQQQPKNQQQQPQQHLQQQQSGEQQIRKERGSVEVRSNKPRKPAQTKKPSGPTIFINPKIIKKFIGKSIELASASSNQPNNASTSHAKGCFPDSKIAPATAATSSSVNLIDTIDLKTSSRESLQAASTMAIIRLVAECIKNDNKRDEKLNKVLVARLVDQLTKHERENSSSSPEDVPYEHGEGINRPGHPKPQYDGISHRYELGSSGLPIPVIGSGNGGSSSNYSPSISRVGQYPPTSKQHGTHYQHRPRHVSSDRRDSRQAENQTNKLRNYSR